MIVLLYVVCWVVFFFLINFYFLDTVPVTGAGQGRSEPGWSSLPYLPN